MQPAAVSFDIAHAASAGSAIPRSAPSGIGINQPLPWVSANDFMYWKLLCYGAEHGYKVFDFGRSKQGTGPYDFKRHWGFEPTPLPYQYHLVTQKVIPNLNPTNPKLSLPIELWKRLPLPVSQWLGPKIVRFFA